MTARPSSRKANKTTDTGYVRGVEQVPPTPEKPAAPAKPSGSLFVDALLPADRDHPLAEGLPDAAAGVAPLRGDEPHG